MGREDLRLVADVGGSNARFALVAGPGGPPERSQTLSTADFPSLAEAVEHYLAAHGKPVLRRAAIAVATPITGDAVSMTNCPWAFSIEETRKRLKLERLLVLNDFEAQALALPHLSAAELRQVGGTAPVADAARAVIGAGTGLGVSGLVSAGAGRWLPVVGEGGHVTLAAGNAREAEVIAACREERGHVSAEGLISGQGLSNLHRALLRLGRRSAPPLSPPEITERGLSGTDPLCREVLDLFCSLLGGVAGNLVLSLGARGGLYIGGGIVPRLGEFFDRSAFRASFEAKGRFAAYLAPVPAYVILAANPGLLGAVAALGLEHPR
jgi:glucokinase